jgi:hypothetical protein
MEFTEGFQDYQHGDETEEQVTCVGTGWHLSAV